MSDDVTYADAFKAQVDPFWSKNVAALAPELRTGERRFETRIRIAVDGDGTLQALDVIRSSGSSQMDGCVVRAVNQARPFAAPPAALLGDDGLARPAQLVFRVILGEAQLGPGAFQPAEEPAKAEPTRIQIIETPPTDGDGQ